MEYFSGSAPGQHELFARAETSLQAPWWGWQPPALSSQGPHCEPIARQCVGCQEMLAAETASGLFLRVSLASTCL